MLRPGSEKWSMPKAARTCGTVLAIAVLSMVPSRSSNTSARAPLYDPSSSVASTQAILAAQNEKEIAVLELGKPIERELAGGQSHSYRVALATGQYIHVVVEQRGIDVVVTLFGPDGKELTKVDSPNGTQGLEPLAYLAETTGNYRLEVRSLENTAIAGRYQVKIDQLRTATEQDKKRILAQQVLLQAKLLREQQTEESLRKAITKYEEFLALSRSSGDSNGEASALYSLGAIYDDLGDELKALDYYTRSLTITRAQGDRQAEAATLHDIGFVHYSLGESTKALDLYGQALLLFRELGNLAGEASTLSNIGAVYADQGDQKKALEYFARTLPLRRTLGDRVGEAATLNNIGRSHYDLGNVEESLKNYVKALELLRAVGDRRHEATLLANIGRVYSSLGEKQKAIEHYSQALSLSREVGDRNGEATALSNLGAVYDSLGEKQRALDYYSKALSIRRAIHDPGGEATSLNNIGFVYDSLGEPQNALKYFELALPLYVSTGDRSGEALALSNIGAAYDDLGQQQKALDYYEKALPLRRSVGDRAGEAATLNNMGKIYNLIGEQEKALDHVAQALSLFRAVGDPAGEAAALANTAYIERGRGNFSESRKKIEATLKIAESLRTKVLSQELRSSYFATVQDHYKFYIDLLWLMHKQQPLRGFDVAAFHTNERARARSLLELLNESHANIRQGIDADLLERERSLQQLLDSKAEVRVRLLSGQHTEEQARAAAGEIESLTAQYQEIESKIRQRSPRYAALTQPEPLRLKAIQQELGPSTLLLEYSLGYEHSYLWLVSSTQIKSFQLPARKEIETEARKYYELLTVVTDAKDKETAEIGSRLSQLLLGPIAAQLTKKRLVVVADGALQYLPFAALPEPSTNNSVAGASPLIAQHEIVSLPSISVLALLRKELVGRKPASKELAVLADPVFYADDERVKENSKTGQAGEHKSDSVRREGMSADVEKVAVESGATRDGTRLSRLPWTRQEAEGIAGLVPVDKTKKALDFAASRELVTSGELSQYRYVHFATHGLVDSVHPELSAIVLSLVSQDGSPQNGFLRAHEIYNLNLPADIVVLSACETALGKDVKGEGLIGLTRGFMYAGAARVVASLWSVRDESTSQLMLSFYRGMIKEGKRPAEALRAAQIKMLRSGRWSAPHYWAPFVLQGEWR